jgi:hypothetical protein
MGKEEGMGDGVQFPNGCRSEMARERRTEIVNSKKVEREVSGAKEIQKTVDFNDKSGLQYNK